MSDQNSTAQPDPTAAANEEAQPESQILTLNGIDAISGNYSTPFISTQELVDKIILQQEMQKPISKGKSFRLSSLFNEDFDSGEPGWGIIFPARADPRLVSQIEEALSPIIDLRRSQTPNFKIYKGANGYRRSGNKGESFSDFLKRQEVGIGPVNPKQMPYYLMLVGDPESIPYSFQFGLDMQYAVGRIYFEKLDDYYHYAQSLVAAEKGQVNLPRRAVFFGTHHKDDGVTRRSAEDLVAPLGQFTSQLSQEKSTGWDTVCLLPAEARKTRLQALLGGSETPALLFTATHGLEWPNGDNRQIPFQGALVCQEYPGPKHWSGELKRDFYLAGEDIASSDNLNLLGMIVCAFACYGGGTPGRDEFAVAFGQKQSTVSRRAFLADLPKKLLSHPKGGALAVIGHVDRAWTYSFQWKDGGQQQEAWRAILADLMSGKPVGKAMESLDERYTTIAGEWLPKIEELYSTPDLYNPYEVAVNWIMAKDARGYALMGDPAARIRLSSPGEAVGGEKPLEIKSFSLAALPEVLDTGAPFPNEVIPSGSSAGSRLGKPMALSSEPPASEGLLLSGSPAAAAQQPTQPRVREGSERKPQPPAQASAGEQPAQEIQPPAGPAQIHPGALLPGSLLDAIARSNQQYALPDGTEAALADVLKSLTGALSALSASLQSFASDLADLDVKTYISNDLSSSVEGQPVITPQDVGVCVAWTNIKLNGDIQVVVPGEEGRLDERLWAEHKDMVKLAQAQRVEMMDRMLTTLERLFGPNR